MSALRRLHLDHGTPPPTGEQVPFEPGKEGIWFDLDPAVYRAAPGVNISALKWMNRSPKHYLDNLLKPRDPKAHQEFGTLHHGVVLEPDKPWFVIAPEWYNAKTKVGKDWAAKQKLPILEADEAESLQAMKAEVLGHPIVATILARAHKEVSVFKRHEATGLLLKGRLDIVSSDDAGNTIIGDLKTCNDAREEEFMRDAAKWQYEQQAAFYIDLLGATSFLFIPVEKESPFGVNVIPLDPDDVKLGRKVNERDLARLLECTRTRNWPGYSVGMKTGSLPGWYRRKLALVE